ncbi:MAG: heavy metal translocating P-type ATPase [Oscillospiraceae bacterium]
MKSTFNITGMTCSACSAHVEKAVGSLTGVKSVSVSLLSNSMQAEYDGITAADICAAVIKAGYGCTEKGARNTDSDSAQRRGEEAKQMRVRLVASVIFLALLMYVSMGHMLGAPLPPFMTGHEGAIAFALTQFLLTLPIMYLNRSYYIRGFKALARRSPNMDTLIAVGSAAAVAYGIFAIYRMGYGLGVGDTALVEKYHMDLYFESAGTILTLITVGKFLESRSKAKTAEALTKLSELAPETATVERGGNELVIPAAELVAGDICVVRSGQRIPADGVVIEGSAAVDESALTGESIPAEKLTGDTVLTASVNKGGFIRIRAERTGGQTTLSQIIELVTDAAAGKAPIARLADRISGVFVPIVMGIAALTFAVWLISGQTLEFALSAGISVLVISCPCALGLATPVAIMAGTGKGAENGILIKSAQALETLHKVNTVVLDKTGTITEGKPVCTDIIEYESGAFAAAYSLERLSEHPVSNAICEEAKQRGISYSQAENFTAEVGRGIGGMLGGKRYFVGNVRLMQENGIEHTSAAEEAARLSADGKTAVIIADETHAIGVIAVADKVKPSSIEAVRRFKQMGIRVIMLTGDNARTAEAVRKQTGIDEAVAEVLPTGKAEHIKRLMAQGKSVAMIGDGINDAPALACADIGIAIGAGTDIAIDSADIVLMKSSLNDAVSAVALGRATIRNIRQNLFWAFFYNTVGIPLAAGVFYPAFGILLNPMIGAAAMSLSSVCVCLNALRLRFFKVKGTQTAVSSGESSRKNTVNAVIIQQKETQAMTKTMVINGMMCNNCKKHVEKALGAIDGVSAVEVNLEEKTAVVTLSAEVSDDIMKNAVTEEGYEVVSISL